jgi:exodeoxyribonuclease VII small subunit
MTKAKPKNKSAELVADMSFEQALAELEQIVTQLEAGQLALDEALVLFERGQALAAHCGMVLDRAELKIQTLAPSTGRPELQDFEEAVTRG